MCYELKCAAWQQIRSWKLINKVSSVSEDSFLPKYLDELTDDRFVTVAKNSRARTRENERPGGQCLSIAGRPTQVIATVQVYLCAHDRATNIATMPPQTTLAARQSRSPPELIQRGAVCSGWLRTTFSTIHAARRNARFNRSRRIEKTREEGKEDSPCEKENTA